MGSGFALSYDSNILKSFAVFAVIFAICAIALFIVRKIAFSSFHRWAKRTETVADDIIIESIKHPSVFWVLAIGLYIALDTSDFPQKYVNYGLTALYAIIVLSVTLAAANISSRLVENAMVKRAANVPVTGLSMAVIKAVIFAIGFLIILNSLGISITPILTALGVGGLAVALALQDTLSNLFAGVHILVERPVRVNDYIRLSSGEEGLVMDIGWRTTRIKELANNIIIVPNNKLSQSIITNYSMPDRRLALLIKVSVSYENDPDAVERALLEVANAAIGKIGGLLSDPPPMARLMPGFGESGFEFTLVCQIAEYTDQHQAQHELRKLIFKRFRAEGIEIPYPTRSVRVRRPSAPPGRA